MKMTKDERGAFMLGLLVGGMLNNMVWIALLFADRYGLL